MTDCGTKGQYLYWEGYKEQDMNIAALIGLEKVEGFNGHISWMTTLLNLGKANFDLISLTPIEYCKKGMYGTTVENIYIFRKIENLEKE